MSSNKLSYKLPRYVTGCVPCKSTAWLFVGEAGGDAAQQCGSSLVFRVRHFHRRMCFPEAERRCWIAAGVAVTIVAHRTQPIENN
ncbi:hypothetical protein OUZ56_021901 [Daphnia magna]|uniref:Uncharacterized protein n=1 Tax=Daphnia magna TaxID=35525 RepID=A0ABR0AUS2_9CRUS|nr:hypothetical protein OUZ56_021901 [Daphnia magna]